MIAPYTPGARRIERLAILAESQNWRCCYCGVPCDYGSDDKDGWDRPSCEHVQALGAGGLRVWENEVMACRLCNTGRARMHPLKYFKKVQKVGRWGAYKWSVATYRKRQRAKTHAEVATMNAAQVCEWLRASAASRGAA